MSETNKKPVKSGDLINAYLAGIKTGKADQERAKIEKLSIVSPNCVETAEALKFIDRLEQSL